MAKRNRPPGGFQPARPQQQPQHTIQRTVQAEQQFQGPIPPPHLLAQYDQLLPGAAERLIKMAEDEAEHRRGIERAVVSADINDRRDGRIEARIGQVCGLAIGLVALGLGTLAALNGAPWFGGFIGTGGVGTLVAIFVYGRINAAAHSNPPPG